MRRTLNLRGNALPAVRPPPLTAILVGTVVAVICIIAPNVSRSSVPSITHAMAQPTSKLKPSHHRDKGIPFDRRAHASASHVRLDDYSPFPGAPSPECILFDPPPTLVSQSQLAWVAVESADEVEMVDEATGEVYGSPIDLPIGSNPTAIAYWQPSPGSTASSNDPIAITANTDDSVSFIDTVTDSILNTISIGSGGDVTSIAASTSSDYAVVADSISFHSRLVVIDVATESIVLTMPDLADSVGQISQVIFDASGHWIEAALPSLHEIVAFQQSDAADPLFVQSSGSTYAGDSQFDPISIAADDSTPTSSTLYVASDGSSPGLYSMTDDPPNSPQLVAGLPATPSTLGVSPGGSEAYCINTSGS